MVFDESLLTEAITSLIEEAEVERLHANNARIRAVGCLTIDQAGYLAASVAHTNRRVGFERAIKLLTDIREKARNARLLT